MRGWMATEFYHKNFGRFLAFAPAPAAGALLLGATLTGFAGLALQTVGYQLEEAAKAGVMTVLEIPFAYLLQYYVFGDDVSSLGILGVSLVVIATMGNLLRQMSKT